MANGQVKSGKTSEVFSLRLPITIWRAIKRSSDKERRTASNWVRIVIEDALRSKGEKF